MCLLLTLTAANVSGKHYDEDDDDDDSRKLLVTS